MHYGKVTISDTVHKDLRKEAFSLCVTSRGLAVAYYREEALKGEGFIAAE